MLSISATTEVISFLEAIETRGLIVRDPDVFYNSVKVYNIPKSEFSIIASVRDTGASLTILHETDGSKDLASIESILDSEIFPYKVQEEFRKNVGMFLKS